MGRNGRAGRNRSCVLGHDTFESRGRDSLRQTRNDKNAIYLVAARPRCRTTGGQATARASWRGTEKMLIHLFASFHRAAFFWISFFPLLFRNGTGRWNRTYFNSGMQFSRSCDGSEARWSGQPIPERASELESHEPGNIHACPFASEARKRADDSRCARLGCGTRVPVIECGWFRSLPVIPGTPKWCSASEVRRFWPSAKATSRSRTRADIATVAEPDVPSRE
jgi:hypothetical protein